jgi:hypothetical protein
MIRSSIPRLAALALVVIFASFAGAQDDPVLECGNAFYDDGTATSFAWFGGGQAGDPDKMYAVRFDLADFDYEPGTVEIAGFCASNQLAVGGLFPNEIFVYPDADGLPDDSVVLAQGQILTGNGYSGASIVMFDEPVLLDGDFWLVNRGYEPLATTDFNMEADAESDSEHSFTSIEGIENLEPAEFGDYMLRAYLQPAGADESGSWLTAGVAHSTGANNTQWRSKYTMVNTGPRVVEATASFINGDDVTEVDGVLQPGQMLTFNDVVPDLFEITDDASGSIRLDADGPLVVTTRTYNIGEDGTFGQFLPGVPEGPVLTQGDRGVISQLANNDEFRTNLGYLNVSDVICRVTTTLYDSDGNQVGEERTRQLDPSGWKQDNNIFDQVGAGTQDDAYAVLEVLTQGCSLWAYGSVVDNRTGDPTTVPVVVQ